jgi:NADPH2:quinone reductase
VQAALLHEFGQLDTLSWEQSKDPVARRDEIVVEVITAEVNFPDLLVIEGKYQFKPPLPFSPGKGAVGRVCGIGSDVVEFAMGDIVIANVEYGAFAEKLAAPAAHCVKVPDGIPFDKAVAMGLVYHTAWLALKERAQLARDESVLVLGASGGVGLATIELAKALGAGKVIAAIRGDRGADIVKAAGADEIVDLAAANLKDHLREQIAGLTEGKGVDIVVDPLGGDATSAALRALAWCGRLIVVGFASGDLPSFHGGYLLVKNISVLGLQSSDYRNRRPEMARAAQCAIFDFYQQGIIDPPIGATLPLANFAHALSMVANGEIRGRIILEASRNDRS